MMKIRVKQKSGNKKKKLGPGLTLIEVLAVLVIIGVITAIAFPNLQTPIKTVQENADSANVLLLNGAVRQFKLDTGTIPLQLDNLLNNPAGGIPGWDGPYLDSIPQSPAGKRYTLDPLTGKVTPQ